MISKSIFPAKGDLHHISTAFSVDPLPHHNQLFTRHERTMMCFCYTNMFILLCQLCSVYLGKLIYMCGK